MDLIAIETIPCLIEAEALMILIKEFPNLQAWISFSCKDEIYLNSGEEFS